MITKISRSLFFVAIIIGMIANRASNIPGASENKTESDRSSCQFKNMAGDLPDKVCFYRAFLERLAQTEPDKNDAYLPKALLFSGPAGTGKTMGAEELATEINIEIIRHDMSKLIKDHGDNLATQIELIYEQEENKAHIFKKPTIILFDDTELKESHQQAMCILNSYIEGKEKSPYILTIITMNKDITQLDPGFQSRVDLVQWSLPSKENRKAVIYFYRDKLGFTIGADKVEELAKDMDGLSCRDIKNIFVEGAEKGKQEQAVFLGEKHVRQQLKNIKDESDAFNPPAPQPTVAELSWGQRHPYLKATGQAAGAAALVVIGIFIGGGGGSGS